MATNQSRSQRRSLLDGSTDGKYKKVRPNTEVAPGAGDAETRLERSHLSPGIVSAWYGDVTGQVPLEQQAYPGS